MEEAKVCSGGLRAGNGATRRSYIENGAKFTGKRDLIDTDLPRGVEITGNGNVFQSTLEKGAEPAGHGDLIGSQPV